MKKDVQLLLKKVNALTKAKEDMQFKMNKLKIDAKKADEKNWRLEREIALLKRENQKLQTTVVSLRESEEKEKKDLQTQIKVLEKRAKKVSTRGQRLPVKQLRELKMLQAENLNLKKKNEDFELLSVDSIAKLKKENQMLLTELSKLRKYQLNITTNSEFLLEEIEKQLKKDSLSISDSERKILKELIERERRSKNKNNEQEEKSKEKNRITKRHREVEDNEKIGYIHREKNNIFFVDVLSEKNRRLSIRGNFTFRKLQSGMTVRVIDNISYVDVKEILSNKKKEARSIAEKEKALREEKKAQQKREKREKKLEARKKKYQELGKHQVLLVGSRFLSKYKDRLEKYGFQVLIHNAYEDSIHLLKSKSNRVDVTVICERHIPHEVYDHISKRDPMVVCINRDNRDIVAREVCQKIKEKETLSN